MSSYFFGRLNNGIVNPRGSTMEATNIGEYYKDLKVGDVAFITLTSKNAIDVIARVRSRSPASGGGGKETVVFDILADLRGNGFSIDHFTRLVFFYLNNEYLVSTKKPSSPFPKLQVVHGQDKDLKSFLASPKGEIERRLMNYPAEVIFRKLKYSPAMPSSVGNDVVFCPDPTAKCGYRYVDTNFMPEFGEQSDEGIDRALKGGSARYSRKFKKWLEASEKAGSSVKALEPTFSALRDVLWNDHKGPSFKKKQRAGSNESETNAVPHEASASGEEEITGMPDATALSLDGLYRSKLPIPLCGYNKVYYGIPGCGKSHKIKNDVTKDQVVIRTTFYEDYSYSDFIGQFRPSESGYAFHAGPFAKALLRAFQEIANGSLCPVYLVIEEINRGNAPSIFGDAFQLLDRDADGKSEYPIENGDLMAYLEKELHRAVESVFIPANLFIIATMNTADQNVFTLDTAFKRRFEWEEIFDDWATCDYSDWSVPGSNQTWKEFVEKINAKIVELRQNSGLSGDMRIAFHFLNKDCLIKKGTAFNPADPAHNEKAKRFAAKIIEYLYDDVAKWDRESLFASDIKTLSEANRKFREACEKGNDSLHEVFPDVF